VRSESNCAACERRLDPERQARCDVCDGARLCLDCARTHLCTETCGPEGCTAGMCVRMVRGGVTAQRYGVTE
jgi:hypothetical protein